jgi:transcriptional regulator with XRE-family HTH domain
VETLTETAGELVKRLREGLGVSQRALADALGVRPQAVSHWERGRSAPARATLRDLDSVLQADGAIIDAYNRQAPPTVTLRIDNGSRIGEVLAAVVCIHERLDALEARLDALEDPGGPPSEPTP